MFVPRPEKYMDDCEDVQTAVMYAAAKSLKFGIEQ
jgi:hypothetical protein